MGNENTHGVLRNAMHTKTLYYTSADRDIVLKGIPINWCYSYITVA